MKKVILILLITVATSGSAWAQKGMMAVGANVAMNVTLSDRGFGIGGGAKFQYNISNYFRVEPSFTYYSIDNSKEIAINMAGLVNIHAFFSSPRTIRPYAFAGFGYLGYKEYEKGYYILIDNYGTLRYYDDNKESNKGGFGVDGGFGLDYRVSHNISLQAEAGIITGFVGGMPISIKANIGVCYTF